jgi:hypothetical protein
VARGKREPKRRAVRLRNLNTNSTSSSNDTHHFPPINTANTVACRHIYREMSEPRRSTRTRIREDAAPETPKDTPSKTAVKLGVKRKRPSVVAKDSVPGTPIREAAQQTPKHVLPIRLVEGQPLPTLPEPQSLDLPVLEYQNIAQRYAMSMTTT